MDISTIRQNIISGLIVAFFAPLLTAGLGPWLASRWNFFLKQRELDLTAVHQRYASTVSSSLYGNCGIARSKLWEGTVNLWKKRGLSSFVVPAMPKGSI